MAQALGAAHIYLLKDPVAPATSPTGVHIMNMESVSFDPQAQSLGLSNAFTGDAWSADGIYTLPPNCSAQIELYDVDIEAIKNFLLGGSVHEAGDAKAFGFGRPGLKKIDPASLPTLFILPAFDQDAGFESEYGIWMPKVAAESLASIVYNRPSAGGNANTYTVSMKAAQSTKLFGQDLPEDCRFAFYGSPTALGIETTGWTLPA